MVVAIEGQVGPSLDRISVFQKALTLLLNAKQASARQLHSIVGQMESMANLLPWGRLHKRPLQWGIKERWSQEDCLWEQQIRLHPWFLRAVQQWLDKEVLMSLSPIHHPPPEFQLFIDSSLDGWGAHLGHMDCRMERTAYQCPRAKSSLPGSSGIYLSCSESLHFVGNRQQNSSSTHQQTGRGDGGGAHSRTLCDLTMQSALWCVEHKVALKARFLPGKLNILADKENESSSDRVVIEPESGGSDLSPMELSSNRSLCYSAEQEVSSVCVTCSRPGGICSGCSFDQLERDVSICVSSISSDITMSQEDTDRGVLSLVNCSSLGGTTLVSSPTIITSCSSNAASCI